MAQTLLELLAPAKDLAHGKAALDCGADAVYIGASRFGARCGAANAPEDIARLADYAHLFGAKVYVTLNTLLFDHELAEAERLARAVWRAGADALIVQDMAFPEMDLPPLPLFASTQTFNLTPERVRFLEEAGFSRVILERAVSLDGIRAIRRATDIPLEAFVHGAICVCYSGQCYLSQAVAGRSGNRGVCAQPCRSDYDLEDGAGNVLLRHKHLLSVRDLALDNRLEELIDAGVTSFKIEGRLKDLAYLRNNTAHYHRRLNDIIAGRPDLGRASAGRSECGFAPDPRRTFSRGFTGYFLDGGRTGVASFDTPKSVGRRLGRAFTVDGGGFRLQGEIPAAGDGLCFTDTQGTIRGAYVTRTEGDRVYLRGPALPAAGTDVCRNLDSRFLAAVNAAVPRRTLAAVFRLREAGLSLEDETGMRVSVPLPAGCEPARDREKTEAALRRQLLKSGDSPFRVEAVEVDAETLPFLPLSAWNALRRQALDALAEARRQAYRRPQRKNITRPPSLPGKRLPASYNVTNRLSRAFYLKAGAETVEPGLDLQADITGQTVMRTRYCLRRETGHCLKEPGGTTWKGPLRLVNNGNRFDLEFDCGRCEMTLVYRGKEHDH